MFLLVYFHFFGKKRKVLHFREGKESSRHEMVMLVHFDRVGVQEETVAASQKISKDPVR